MDILPQAKFYIKKSLKGIYPFEENLYQKLPFLAFLCAVRPHFLSHNGEITCIILPLGGSEVAT